MLNVNEEKVKCEIEKVLSEYGIPWRREGINEIFKQWFLQKKWLLEAFSKHPNWSNDSLAIIEKKDFVRATDPMLALEKRRQIGQHIIFPANGIMDNETRSKRIKFESLPLPGAGLLTPAVIEEIDLPAWLSINPKAKAGTRLSRAYRKICEIYGYDKDKTFEHDFAAFADTLSPKTLKRTALLSFHPCDYLLMSHGTGWGSCHMINGGGWQGGTWSYMLDDVTGIYYTLNPKRINSEPTWNGEKISRMVCCFSDAAILFSRLYPQGDVENKEFRKTIRQHVHEIFSECFGIENYWKAPVRGDSLTDVVKSGDGHKQYPDYNYREYGAELSYHSKKTPSEKTIFTIGTTPICPVCGEKIHGETNQMTCGCESKIGVCDCCGDTIWVDDYHHRDSNNNLVCSYCWDRHYEACDRCEGIFHENDVSYLEALDEYLCESCYEEAKLELENEQREQETAETALD